MLKDYSIDMNKKQLRCPNEETMACYIDGLLPKEEVEQILNHLAICDRCREIVEVTRKIKEKEK